MKKSIVLIPLPSLIKNSFVRSFVRSLSLSLSHSCVRLKKKSEVPKLASLLTVYVRGSHNSTQAAELTLLDSAPRAKLMTQPGNCAINR